MRFTLKIDLYQKVRAGILLTVLPLSLISRCFLDARQGGRAMYALIIVIAMEQVGGTSIAVTSQIIGKFSTLEACKVAATKPHGEGPISDLSPPVSWGGSWFCTYTGGK